MKLYRLIPAVALLFASCSEDEMDRINTDYGNPPVSVINGRLMITDAITSTGFRPRAVTMPIILRCIMSRYSVRVITS